MLEFLMNNIFRFFEALEQNKVLLTCVLIYMIGFVLLAICGVWEYVQNKYNNSNQQNIRALISKYKIISRLIEYLAIVYLPILIPFWLMLAVCKSIYWLIHNYAENFFHSLLMVCLLPITIFNIFGEKLTKKNIAQWLKVFKEKIEKNFKKVSKQRSIITKLKIYQQYTKDIANINSSFVKDYFEEHSFKFLAALLQVVSFFTTYAGAEIFFGRLFDAAPLFITLVIQVGLYKTSVTAFKLGEKNFRKKCVMMLLFLVSIVFSYVGLITLACPPENDYQTAYQEYKTAFDNLKSNILENVSNDTSAAQAICKELLKVQDTLKEVEKQLEDKQNKYDSLKEPVRTNSVQINSIDENGQLVVTTRNYTTDEWNIYNQTSDALRGEIISLKSTKEELFSEIAYVIGYNNTMETEDDTNTIDSDFYESLMDFLSEENILLILQSYLSLEDDIYSEDLELFNRLIRSNNNALNNDLLSNIRNTNKIDTEIINDYIKQIEKSKKINNLSLPEFSELKNDNTVNQIKIIKQFIVNIGNLVGADLNNSDMRELLLLHQKICDTASSSYQQLLLYFSLSNDIKLKENLDECKENIDKIPNIFFTAFMRFKENGSNKSNAIICSILALLNDGLTLLLGWAGTRKSYSFLYVKSSKDYYDDIDELFEIIFKSLTQDFYISIHQGDLISTDIASFTQECISYVSETTQIIRNFLELFTLSECTCSMGYNLKYLYKDENMIQCYLPIISMLIKTNLMKVIPVEHYQHLELEYYCAINLPLWQREENGNKKVFEYYTELNEIKNKGNVLLLRNKAENYLRENMSIEVEDK